MPSFCRIWRQAEHRASFPNQQEGWRAEQLDVTLTLSPLDQPLSHLPLLPPQVCARQACWVTLPPWAFLSNSAGCSSYTEHSWRHSVLVRPQADPESAHPPHPGSLLPICSGSWVRSVEHFENHHGVQESSDHGVQVSDCPSQPRKNSRQLF